MLPLQGSAVCAVSLGVAVTTTVAAAGAISTAGPGLATGFVRGDSAGREYQRIGVLDKSADAAFSLGGLAAVGRPTCRCGIRWAKADVVGHRDRDNSVDGACNSF